jgi:hypothetical protein
MDAGTIWFTFCGSVLSLSFLTAGALLTISPPLFVKVYRRVSPGDWYAKSEQWAAKFEGLEARICGVLFLATGVLALWMLLKFFHAI